MNDLNYEKIYSMCETYQTTPSKNGKGTFFFTDCGNQMYSVGDEFTYHKKLCPKCWKTLLLRGTKDGTDYMDWKLGNLKFDLR